MITKIKEDSAQKAIKLCDNLINNIDKLLSILKNEQ